MNIMPAGIEDFTGAEFNRSQADQQFGVSLWELQTNWILPEPIWKRQSVIELNLAELVTKGQPKWGKLDETNLRQIQLAIQAEVCEI